MSSAPSFPAGDNPSAVVFDVQRFSLHDGPGIRTTVFLKGCPLRCAWCQNPESHKAEPEIAFYAERCVRCFDCLSVCPRGAISAGPRRVADEHCNACGACSKVCRQQALVLVGRSRDADSLAEEVKRDLDFYQDSGGGVTFSGGEPMLHSAFLLQVIPRLRQVGMHVNLETSGAFPWNAMEPLLAMLDLIYFDLKIMDPALHAVHTRADNRGILRNFTMLSERFPPLQARMPLIPGITDTESNLVETARFLKASGHHCIHCLPYHPLGEAKLARIASELEPFGNRNPAAADPRRAISILQQEGIDAVIYA
ncbi:MAG: glycyl-radical enzyme activating protein [Thermodesulfobacteriota bacterium]